MIHLLIDAETHRLKTRLRDLLALQALVANEIGRTRRDIRHHQGKQAALASKPACGTEQSYQWHRYHQREAWPLPESDPCGCRAAHAEWNRIRDAIAKGSAA